MKTTVTKESRGSPPVRRMASSAHRPIGMADRAQREQIRTILQPKLTIGQANDKYEQEADRAADQVVAGQPVPQITPISGALSSTPAQKSESDIFEEKPIQAKLIQRQPGD